MSRWAMVLLVGFAGCGWVRALRGDDDGHGKEHKDDKDDKDDKGGKGDKDDKDPADRGDPGHAFKLERATARGTRELGPDLLIVTWDTTRADHVGAYGYARDTTPVIDALAAECAVFDRFIVPMSTTLPSHTSLFTGVRPEEHGILANATFTGERFVPSEQLTTLATWLSRQGYRTAGFVSSTPVKQYSGIAAGFQDWNEPQGDHRRAADTVDRALEWLDKVPDDAPLFMWVHLYDPHHPYAPIRALADHFEEDAALRKHIADRDIGHRGGRERVVERMNAYDTDLFYTDRETGRLLDGWRGGDRWGRTILVLAGDHGEGLGQHDHMEHGLVWDEQLHAPLLIRAPGLAPRRVPFPMSAHDVLPTVLGLVELPDEATLTAQITGHDVLAEGYAPGPVFSRSSVRQVKLGTNVSFAMTTSEWKAIIQADHPPALYDLVHDPYERDDVADDHPEVVAELRALGKSMFEAQRALAERLGAGKTEKLDAGTLHELQQLGYME
ncbi:MAG TPA: sulfatase [Myxococcota bacterium]|nr:sulfatase [Myxococcota bacterium]